MYSFLPQTLVHGTKFMYGFSIDGSYILFIIIFYKKRFINVTMFYRWIWYYIDDLNKIIDCWNYRVNEVTDYFEININLNVSIFLKSWVYIK